jgi:hypothetical protein
MSDLVCVTKTNFERQMTRILRPLTAIFLALFVGTISATRAQELRITGVAPAPNEKVIVTGTGSSTGSVDLQGSSDFRNWTKLQTFPPGAAVIFTDSRSAGRFYRLTSGSGSNPLPTSLPDLGELMNRVFPAPESLSTVQYAPNGDLAYIAWRDQSLVVRERNSGAWTESVLNNNGNVFSMLTQFTFGGPRQDYAFQPSAAIVYDSQSRPHVYQASGTSIIHYAKNGAAWSEVERIDDPQANAAIAVLEVVIGAGDVVHFAALSAGAPRNLTYGSNRGGSWNWTGISSVSDADPYYWAPPFAPRWLSMAIDGNNAAHIAYRSSMDITRDDAGHPRAYSVLKYASNRSGSWQTDQVVQTPADPSGEAANGASIAIAPDGQPRIISWYDERADSGSAQESRLNWHQQDASGNWSSDIIQNSPDGYAAGDGPKGTGFSPQLRYDQSGRAHIVFLDHAGEHFSNIGQQEYAGNLRHAWWNGSGWSVETLARQTNPLEQQMVFPTFAISNNNELAVTYLERNTQWNLSSYPPMANSRYYFRFLTKPLP